MRWTSGCIAYFISRDYLTSPFNFSFFFHKVHILHQELVTIFITLHLHIPRPGVRIGRAPEYFSSHKASHLINKRLRQCNIRGGGLPSTGPLKIRFCQYLISSEGYFITSHRMGWGARDRSQAIDHVIHNQWFG